ncbi:MAG: HlyD family efflux transporter periplasmic adaptor subunit [Burkholderiaceae bacterium]|nr:HlyD family efflux transporter periplasmic adaptor subunit [Burkholderiaceae bacterium]
MSGAPVYSLSDRAQAATSSAAWVRFAAPASLDEFWASWLDILCAQVGRVNGALLFLGGDGGGSYQPAAAWPGSFSNLVHLGPTAEETLKQRRGVVSIGAAPEPVMVGYPIELDGRLCGAVVLDIEPRSEAGVQLALRLVHWGSAWAIDMLRQQQVSDLTRRAEYLGLANEVIATTLQEIRLGSALLAAANELVARLGCERVAIGLKRGDGVLVEAISHTATFDSRSDLVRRIGDAMEEVLDLDVAIVHPPLGEDAIANLAHAALSSARSDACLLSVPLVDDGDMVGVITFERVRERPFDSSELGLCKTVGMLLGPIVELKRYQERGLWQRSVDALRGGAKALFGPGRPGIKLISLIVVLVIAAVTLVDTTYRVASQTVIEGEVQRAMVAPFRGYVAESFVRSGDTVKSGQALARLDDRELVLERTRWQSEAEQAQRRLRQAAAIQDRAAMLIASAQSEQARAKLALVEEQISRATLKAPFDGIVVVGDLSQLLGSPLEQGAVLFEIAPLDSYRVVLNVDEREIADVRVGQRGELALSGMPYQLLPFSVQQITPISTPQDGRNFFRVEARLERATDRLRPGMEGIGKVEIGDRKLIWIWTHSLVDWMWLWSWKWLR